jgi:hypothetical protein
VITDNKTPSDLKQGFDESCLVDGLVGGPRKSNIIVQFMGRINRRNMPSPTTVVIAPTGKAHAQLQQQLDQPSQGDTVHKLVEELDPSILNPKFL